MSAVFNLAVPIILFAVCLYAAFRGVDIYSALTDGAKDGLYVLRDMFTALIILFPAVYMLRASGALEAFSGLLSPLFTLAGIPPETAPLALLRPISGSAATAAAADIIERCGADSLSGRTAAVMLGSSETTFYVAAVYFTAAGIKNTRWAIPAALCADAAVFLSSAWICSALWG